MPEGSAERKEAEEEKRPAGAAVDLGQAAAVPSTYMARTLPGFLLMLSLALAACDAAVAQEVALPPPQLDGDTSLEEAVYQRQSVRNFADTSLERRHIGQLLWSGTGHTVDGVTGPTRAAASAGGLYPIRAYAVLGDVEDIEAGVYRYRWRSHELERVRTGDVRRELRLAALGQGAVGRAPAVVVLAADYGVTQQRYGERGVERYVHMDAGHAAQNVILQAQALGLGAAPIGAFTDAAVKRVLRTDLAPMYLIPVGHPR